jgi:copper(I)-binding protein
MITRRSFAAAALAALAILPATLSHAQHAMTGAIGIDGAWTRATAPRAANGGAFMTIRNGGDAPDTLIAAASPAAARTELHTHTMQDGMMRMRPVEGGIPIPPHGTAELAPGGLHVMMMGLHAPLAEGSRVAITLIFEKAGSVTVEVPVMKAGAAGPMPHGSRPMEGHGMKPMTPPRDPAPHSGPAMTPGGRLVQP